MQFFPQGPQRPPTTFVSQLGAIVHRHARAGFVQYEADAACQGRSCDQWRSDSRSFCLRAAAEMGRRVKSEKDQIRSSPFPKPPLAIVPINEFLRGFRGNCLDDCVAGGFRVPGQTYFTFEQARGKKHSFAWYITAMLSCATAKCSRGLSVVRFEVLRNSRNNASEKKNEWLEDLGWPCSSLEGAALIRFSATWRPILP